MAVTTNLFKALDVGSFGWGVAASAQLHHEDFIDVQVILGSTQCPAFSTFRKDRCYDPVHSWSVDALAATSTAGEIEGQSFGATALTNAVRLLNGTQIFSKHIAVSDREREARPAGQFRDQYEKQQMMGFKEITRNSESRMFATGVSASASGDTTTAPLMRSIPGFGISLSAASASGVFTADIIRLSTVMFNNGVEPDSIWFAPAHKIEFFNAVVVSGSGYINVRNIAAMDNRFQANVEVMETPLGQLYAIITDRFIPTSNLSATTKAGYYIMDRSMLSLPFYRPPQHKEMGKAGDDTRGIILMEHTLRIDHPSAVGSVTGITAA